MKREFSEREISAIETESGRCWTVGRYRAAGATVPGVGWFPLWSGKIYEIRTLADGRRVWSLVDFFGPTRSGNEPSDRYLDELAAEAERLGLGEFRRVRQWSPVESFEDSGLQAAR